ncbi:MAG: hypothetical protein V2A58_05340 [Planctomycetota bacterium]
MKTTSFLVLIALAGFLFCGAAGAQEKATVRVRVVVASNERSEPPIPTELADVANVLRKQRYASYRLVGDKRYRMGVGEEVTQQLTDVDRLELALTSIGKADIKLTVALLRWDKDKEGYKTTKKMLVTLRAGESYALFDDRVRVNDMDTFLFVTYVPD